MILRVTHPNVAFRDCAHCLRFVYDEATGDPALFRGEPLPRGTTKAPCQSTIGCPKGTPDSSLALSERNRQALAFHRRCEAVGRWPRDAIVEENAVIIGLAEREAAAIKRERESENRRRRNRDADPEL